MTGPYQEAVIKFGGQRAAARGLGLPWSTFKDRLAEEIEKPEFKKTKQDDPHFARVVYFTDAHNQPGMSVERFIWLSKFINEQKPDYIVDGGDFDDFQSLCSHERNETYKGRLKPSIEEDLSASEAARKILADNIKHKCKKIVTLGNHEHRIKIYENQNPEVYGIITSIYSDILTRYGWEEHPYGEYVDIFGVNFTHAPFNTMGKPVGGETACKQIADKSLSDVVWGHTHKLDIWNSPKFGESKSTTAFNGGCFMPSGYIPKYAKDTRKEFWYGCHLITISNKKIKSIKSWCMEELEVMYS